MINFQRILGREDEFFTLLEASAQEGANAVSALKRILNSANGSPSLKDFAEARRKDKELTTTLEEMAIEETAELCSKVATRFGVTPRAVLANMVSPLAKADAADVAALQSSDAGFRFALDRGELERARLVDVTSRLGVPAYPIERARDFASDLDLLVRIGAELKGVPQFA